MKFLFFSPHGDSAGIAHRVQEEGNDVWLYIVDQNAKATLEGIVPQVQSVAAGLAKNPDVVFFDMVGYGDIAVRMQKLGFKVIGSGALFKGEHVQDKIELDRAFGSDVMKSGGILTPETIEFKGSEIQKAIKFIREKNKPYVTKPNDNKTPFTTYVPDSVDDNIEHLQRAEDEGQIRTNEKFILQEMVDGIEISTEMWFTKGKPIYPANGTMETKKFLVGNLGPNTGCSTSLVWFYEKKQPKIVQLTLKKIFTFMEICQYTGPIDLNAIVSKKDHKPYGLEWTARPGYSAIYALIRLLDLKHYDLAQHLHLIATGELAEFYIRDGFGYSLRVSVPPYPLCIEDDKTREKLFKETGGQKVKFTGDEESFFPLDVRQNEKGEMETAGVDGVVGEVTGRGDTIENAKNEAHAQFKKLSVPHKQARLDGWKRPMKEIPILESWGYEMPKIGGTNGQLPSVA